LIANFALDQFFIVMIYDVAILIGNWFGSNAYLQGNPANIFLNFGNRNAKNQGNFSILPRNNKLQTILSYIENEYVDTVNIAELTEAAIPEIVQQLDPHSVYIPARELQKYNEPLKGNFSGIGIQFNMMDDTVAVINTIPNGPSEMVGLLPGDRIVLVDDTLIAGVNFSTDQVIRRLKGEKGSLVKVSVYRRGNDELLDFEIIRDDIPLYSVDVSYMISEKTGYIKISNFSQTTFDEFMNGVKVLHNKGMSRLILDLRGNGGGLMEPATNIADQFLEGKKMIVYTMGKNRPKFEIFSTNQGELKNDEVIILIDEFSASASEILAGAIQDNDRGMIIGRRSFGKGLVQEQTEFTDGSALRLTIARYYTPTGRSIQKPYELGDEKYYEDLSSRFENGEFINPDSIHFADSLKFTTPGGKTVYGGGGIMPDIFIPFDTTGFSDYFTSVRSKLLVYRFAFDYTEKYREKLSGLKDHEKVVSYLEKNTNYFNDFIYFADKKGVKPVWTDIRKSEMIIRTQIKAYIARNLLDNEGYFPIIKEIDQTLLEAIRIFEEDNN